MKRRNPRITVAAILGILGAILSIPVVDYLRDYLQGREDRFLYPLGFESGITGTPSGWVLSLLVAAAFILFTIKGIPAVAETWRELSFLKVISIYLAIVAAIVEEALFRRVVMVWWRRPKVLFGFKSQHPRRRLVSPMLYGV